ncbi:hypothetical protein [Reichenbachiella agariperforans]|uniref:hypothetical protein n=1 Tax=Reichenbachiella agariperforans TaxID=156994 RepID=UPI001C093D4A|nr:hypothetical protein [Reichenbachiella agariperforans]MBU2915522.1 hypothetical protein [Reichenbachiella agariperforans]
MKNYWLGLIFLVSCSALEGEQKTNVNEIIKTQEIRQLNEAEVIIAAEQFGVRLYGSLDSLLHIKSDCQSILAREELIVDSLCTVISGQIKLGFSEGDFVSRQEKDLYAAYQYNNENGVSSQPAIQRMDDKYALYTVPYDVADRFYADCVPNSAAVGMWSLVIPIKSVINSLD